MSGTIGLYDIRSLTAAINKVKTPEPFVLKTFFSKNSVTHSSDKVDIEITEASDRIAQFVSANEEPHLIGKQGKNVKTITLPRTFEKKVFDVTELADYDSIGNIYGTSAEERRRMSNQWVLRELDNLKDRVIRRREQLACAAINAGEISISQDNIEFDIEYDFTTAALNSGGHIFTLSTKWTSTDSDPLKDIFSWRKTIMRRSGMNPDILILGDTAAETFLANTMVRTYLDNNNYRMGQLDLNKDFGASGVFLGNFEGVKVYAYTQQYTDADGTTTDMIGSKKAIMGCTQSKNNRLHKGPVYRINKGSKQLDIKSPDLFVESFVNDEGSILKWQVEQKSLPAIHVPDEFLSVTVA